MSYSRILVHPDLFEGARIRVSLYTRQSSANSQMAELTFAAISLMKINNSKGPRTVPCGTPDRTGAGALVCPSMTTLCVLLERNDLIQPTTFFI